MIPNKRLAGSKQALGRDFFDGVTTFFVGLLLFNNSIFKGFLQMKFTKVKLLIAALALGEPLQLHRLLMPRL
ncbi:hypothetical protein [Limosilactobacillus pulli]|uniref:hypothetical protein n=1 Tax=Limosilactobacillus pulli TaxID=2991833 RepID=UPI0024B8DD7E|nr:hypothetical protein [Limosilactobacillus pulli]